MPDSSRMLAVRCRQVLDRLLGSAADRITLEVACQTEAPTADAALEAEGDHLRLSGGEGPALGRALLEYLRREWDFHWTWEGRRHRPEPRSGRLPAQRISSPFRLRHHMNVVTFGYSTAFWDWSRWEREIDWMFLQGINLPLSLEGQEAIWYRVWRELGIPDAELEGHFAGPAFLAWQRMGNLNGHGGPLPLTWIEDRLELQQRIFARQRELGMMPLIHGFAGFVPAALTRHFPGAAIQPTSGWAGFEPTWLLSPRDPLFAEIAQLYMKTYRELIGETHYYLSDPFNEMVPTFFEEEKVPGLEATGEALVKAITANDPDGVWVTQGWQFISYEGRKYWGAEEIGALMRHVPDEHFLLLDLACDITPVWELHESFSRKPWIMCFLHNFGGSTSIYGDLPFYREEVRRTIDSPCRGHLHGMGMTPEGIEQNGVVYAWLAELMWHPDPELEAWLGDFLERRYGGCPAGARAGWAALLNSVYRQRLAFFSRSQMPNYTRRPMLVQPPDLPNRPERRSGQDLDPAPARVDEASRLFVEALDDLAGEPIFVRDMIDVLKRHLAEQGDSLIEAIRKAWHVGNAECLRHVGEELLELLEGLDELLHLEPAYRMATHVAKAREQGGNVAEADLYQRNLQMQVTIWGYTHQKPGRVDRNLTDYGRKEWSGLVGRYYRARWECFLERLVEACAAGRTWDEPVWVSFVQDWENNWADTLWDWPDAPARDPRELVGRLWERWNALPPTSSR